ncbi:MAG: hypothetical protein M2R45_03285 [Verrucomicrobia subdivision 3 bacterium]|nr:hypothetical protein [Limisphaerales bacterium]MCS1416145.1 hypothetical protein [Limisphaerales bacterium]
MQPVRNSIKWQPCPSGASDHRRGTIATFTLSPSPGSTEEQFDQQCRPMRKGLQTVATHFGGGNITIDGIHPGDCTEVVVADPRWSHDFYTAHLGFVALAEMEPSLMSIPRQRNQTGVPQSRRIRSYEGAGERHQGQQSIDQIGDRRHQKHAALGPWFNGCPAANRSALGRAHRHGSRSQRNPDPSCPQNFPSRINLRTSDSFRVKLAGQKTTIRNHP